MEFKDQVRLDVSRVSPLITKVDFCPCFGDQDCTRPTIYIHHKGQDPNYYHCVHVSADGLMVNSNGYHPLDVHDAMNEAVKVAREALGL